MDHQNNARPYSKGAVIGLLAGLLAVALLLVAAWGTRADRWHFTRGLEIAEWAVAAAAAGLILALWGLAAVIRSRGQRRGLVPSLVGLALTLPLLAMGAYFEYAAHAYPPINDVTTDPDEPLTFWEVPDPEVYPGGETAELQREHYPDIQPLSLDADPDTVFDEARALAEAEGWEIVAANDGELEAVAESRLFGFKDNVMVRVAADNGSSRVDMRSYSRLGRIDRGVNAKRIRAYLDTLETRVTD